jgi:hypothetical protein
MKKIIFIGLITLLTSCVNEINRFEYLKQTFKEYEIRPSTSNNQYDYLLIKNSEIIGVRFYPFSETKISTLTKL